MVMDCEPPQVEPVREGHLIEDVGEVTLDRVLADGEGVCDVHVRGAHCDRSDDLQLTRRQSKRLALYRSPRNPKCSVEAWACPLSGLLPKLMAAASRWRALLVKVPASGFGCPFSSPMLFLMGMPDSLG
jgi:hypothetical protein